MGPWSSRDKPQYPYGRLYTILFLLVTSGLFLTRQVSVAQGQGGLEMILVTDKTAYIMGEHVNMSIVLLNKGVETVTLTFPGDCQVSFLVEDSTGSTIYDERLHQTSCQYPSDLILVPGQGSAYNLTWNQIDDNGVQAAAPEAFTMIGMMLSNEPAPTASAHTQVRVLTGDFAIEEIAVSRDLAYSGVDSQPVDVNVTVANHSMTDRDVTVILKAEGMTVGTQAVILPAGQSVVAGFVLSPHLLPKGGYSLSAEAYTPTGEISAKFAGPSIMVRSKGDVNGDCAVNIDDLARVGATFGSTDADPRYDRNADLNNDGAVNVDDLANVGSSFGNTCPPNVDTTLGNDQFSRQQVEPTIAVHPLKPEIVLAGAQDLRLVELGANRWHGYYRSTDGGQTWSISLLPGYPTDNSPEGSASPIKGCRATTDPVLTADRQGNVFYTGIALGCIGGYKTFVTKYAADGATYTSTVTIGPPTFHDKPWIAVDNSEGPYDGYVYLVWDMSIDGFFTSVFSRSTDHGATFSPPVRLPFQTVQTFLPFVTVDPLGRVFVATKDENNGSILVSRSSDGGVTWTTVTAVSGITIQPGYFPGNGFRAFTIPQIAADQNGVYLIWDDFRTGDSDVLMSRSTDGGATWASPMRVNDVSIGQQFFGAISTSPAGISIAYYDSRFDDGGTIEKLDVFLTRSLTGGVSFLPSTRITSQSFNPNLVQRTVDPGATEPFMGDYIGVASTTTSAYLVWADNRNVSAGAPLDQDVYVSKFSF